MTPGIYNPSYLNISGDTKQKYHYTTIRLHSKCQFSPKLCPSNLSVSLRFNVLVLVAQEVGFYIHTSFILSCFNDSVLRLVLTRLRKLNLYKKYPTSRSNFPKQQKSGMLPSFCDTPSMISDKLFKYNPSFIYIQKQCSFLYLDTMLISIFRYNAYFLRNAEVHLRDP